MELGDRLRQAREMADLSQTQVKSLTGINNKSISNYEHNVSAPPTHTLKLLADLYNVPLEWLLAGGHMLLQDSQEHMVTISDEEFSLLAKLRSLPAEKRMALEILISDTGSPSDDFPDSLRAATVRRQNTAGKK